MIFRPDTPMRLAVAALMLVITPALVGCAEETSTADPIDQARMALQRGDGIGAEVMLRKAMDDGVARDRIAALLGEAELIQGNLPEAREWLEPGQFDDASRGQGFHTLARLEMRSGNLPAAGVALDKAYSEKPDDPELWVDIGRLRYRGGEQVQAIEAAERAVELGPQNPLALHFRGQLVRDAHGLKAALPWFEAALQQSPDHPQLLVDYAATLGELGRATEMLATVRHLEKVDPSNPQVHFLQAVLAARAGNSTLARSLLLRSGDLEREVPAAMLLSAIIDMQNGNHASGAQLLERLSELQPDNRRVATLLARALLAGRNERELVHRFAGAARKPSASPYLMMLVGRGYESLGQRDEAASYLDRAAQPRTANLIALQGSVELGATKPSANASGGDVLSAIRTMIVDGRTAQAAREGKAFAERYPGSADALGVAGDSQLAAKRPEAAIELYRTASKVRRPWPLTRRMIMAYRGLGKLDEGNKLLATHLAGDPNNSEAAGLLAVIQADLGRWDKAEKLLDHALAHGAARDPRLLAMRARAAGSLSDGENANQFAVAAHYVQPNNALAANMLAVIKGHSGEDGKVVEMLLAKARALGRSEKL